jgi:hypothetical protein
VKRRASLGAGRGPEAGLTSIYWRTDDSCRPDFMRPNSALHPQADEQATATQNRKLRLIGTADPGVGRKNQQSRAGVSFQHPDHIRKHHRRNYSPRLVQPSPAQPAGNCPTTAISIAPGVMKKMGAGRGGRWKWSHFGRPNSYNRRVISSAGQSTTIPQTQDPRYIHSKRPRLRLIGLKPYVDADV